ncbi:hypothetical protein ITP31_004765 [Salmonella enterica]|nr:hypothetical protein [Salmonella enterica]
MDNLKPPSADLDGDALNGSKSLMRFGQYRKTIIKKGPGKGRKAKRRAITYVWLSF